MRARRRLERKAEQVDTFTLDDLQLLIFSNTSPTITTFPFRKLNRSPLSKVPVTFSLVLFETKQEPIKLLSQAIIDFNGMPDIAPDSISKLYPWMYHHLLRDYEQGVKEWQDYIFNHITDVIKETASIIQWRTVQTVGITGVFPNTMLNFVQKLWISTNVNHDQKRWVDFAVDMKESLLPWLDAKLFSEYKKQKDDKRDNVAYDEQRKLLKDNLLETTTNVTVLDQLDELDIIE